MEMNTTLVALPIVIVATVFAPTITAAISRGPVMETFVLNLMAGWTIIGWRDAWKIALRKMTWRELQDWYGTKERKRQPKADQNTDS